MDLTDKHRRGGPLTPSRRLRRGLVWGAVAIVALCGGTLVAASGRITREQSTYSGPQARECVPGRLNASDVLPATGIAVSPLPDSRDASPRTQVSMLGVPKYDILAVAVTGSDTGRHAGRLLAYSQGDGASFVPNRPFRAGERVTVRGRLRTAYGLRSFAFHFRISYPDPVRFVPYPAAPAAAAGQVQSFQSQPSLHPPTLDVTLRLPQSSSRDIMLTPYKGPGQTGPMIVEPDGQLVWMDRLPANASAANLQVQKWEGRNVLTWWQGYIPEQGFGLGEEIVANDSYQPIMRVRAGNGYLADLHDFRMYANGTAVLTVFNTIHCDLSADGGPRDGAVTDTVFQELDLRTGLVRREWHSVDHIPISASDASPQQASAEWPFDYVHVNTVDPRPNGTTLLSARNTSALYVIDTRTGQVLATAGGKYSTVTLGPGAATAYQHDAQTLPNGDISVFDNGGKPFVHAQSRALLVRLNLRTATDTEITELVHTPPLQSASQGNAQQLPHGGWFVDWGAEPYVSEFNAAGQMVYDAHMAPLTQSYRAYAFPWTATPTQPPAIAVERQAAGATVFASWNGATAVAAWRVLGARRRRALAPIVTAPRTGFETAIVVPAERRYAIEALDAHGRVIGHSASTER